MTRAANKGHAKAQHLLGAIYEEERAYRTAVKWYRLAAWQGQIPAAQYALACLYYSGLGIKRDVCEAAKWMRAAAEGGDVNAQYNLGLFYFRGEGVVQDYPQAFTWLKLVAADASPKDVEAAQTLETSLRALEATITPKLLAKAEKLITRLKAQIAKRVKKANKPPRPSRRAKGPKYYLGAQEVWGDVCEWRTKYAIQRHGDDWVLFVEGEGGNKVKEGPMDAARPHRSRRSVWPRYRRVHSRSTPSTSANAEPAGPGDRTGTAVTAAKVAQGL